MFRPDWVNPVAGTVFAAIALLAAVRLIRPVRPGYGRLDTAGHGVMAAGMAAMAVPTADPLPRWLWAALFAGSATLTVAALVRLGPAYGRHGLAIGAAAWQRSTGHAGYHLAASLFMLLALAVDHSGHDAPLNSMALSGGGHHVGGGSVGSSLPGSLGWLFAGCFLVAACCAVAELVRRRGERGAVLWSGCVAVMGGGMAAMAVAMS